jgi:predicted nucleic acid-binding protein
VEFYVEFAADLDDGEAMALAIARARAWLLATDDRKARRRAVESGVSIVTTPELMKRWADSSRVPAEEIRSALERIQARARFVPAPDFPEYEWWTARLGQSDEPDK